MIDCLTFVFSWAFDGNRRLKWWAQEEKRWGGKWKYGDVVGCACDLEVLFPELKYFNVI